VLLKNVNFIRRSSQYGSVFSRALSRGHGPFTVLVEAAIYQMAQDFSYRMYGKITLTFILVEFIVATIQYVALLVLLIRKLTFIILLNYSH
jgi:hypothetical protein